RPGDASQDATANTWLVRTRDGREATYQPSVVLDAASRTQDHTYAWRLTRIQDPNHNLIEYGYDGRPLQSQLTAPAPGRLRDIWYGGNSGNGNAGSQIPHLFHVALVSDQQQVTPDSLQQLVLADAPTPFSDCAIFRGREDLVSFRPGGPLQVGGATSLLRA